MKAGRLGSAAAVTLVVATAATVTPLTDAVTEMRSEQAKSSHRIVYSTDWGGPSQIYAVDPRGKAPRAQITFGREPAGCWYSPVACGYVQPVPSPDGRWIVYRTAGSRVSEGSTNADAWIARTNGSGARRLPGVPSYYGLEWTQWSRASTAWSRDGRRFAYATTDGGMRVVDVPGFRTRLVPGVPPRPRFPAWSPDGTTLALRSFTEVVVWRDGHSRVVASGPFGGPGWPYEDLQSRVGWSPDGRWIAYRADGKVAIVDPRGRGRRILGEGAWAQWSPVASTLAFVSRRGVMTYEPGARAPRRLSAVAGTELTWSPNGRRLAIVGSPGITVVEVANRRARRLTSDAAHEIAWAPDGQSLAYLRQAGESTWANDIRVVTLDGRARNVVAAAAKYGGRTSSPAWLTLREGTRFRRPAATGGVYAGGPVSGLAADGGLTVFVVCGHVYAMRRGTSSVRLDDRTIPPDCVLDSERANHVQALVVADGRVAYQVTNVGLGYTWELVRASPGRPISRTRLDSGFGNLGAPTNGAAGAGHLLVFSTWPRYCDPSAPGCPLSESWQEVRRVDADGTSSFLAREPLVATFEAAINPLDVDGERILTRRSGYAAGSPLQTSLSVWSADGRKLLLLYVDALSAALSEGDIVVRARDDTLRVYDAATGDLRRQWQFSGRLEDVSHGLVATIVDGSVRIVRLADGSATTVAPATFARFDDAGLTYADGSRIRFVAWTQLRTRFG